MPFLRRNRRLVLALRLAGWPDDRPVWTGSCPCQPFSAAGEGKAADDERHLWPDWFPLIAERRLQSSLESRLRRRLDGAGSTLFSLTWKNKATPAGRPYCQLAASARRTSDSEYGSWPTPCSQDGPNGGPSQGIDRLPGEASQAAWPTASTNDTLAVQRESARGIVSNRGRRAAMGWT